MKWYYLLYSYEYFEINWVPYTVYTVWYRYTSEFWSDGAFTFNESMTLIFHVIVQEKMFLNKKNKNKIK